MHYTALIALVSRYASRIDRKEATISNWIVGHARLFSRLRQGHGCTVETYNRALQWFSDRWPADLEWPADVPRPPQAVSETTPVKRAS